MKKLFKKREYLLVALIAILAAIFLVVCLIKKVPAIWTLLAYFGVIAVAVAVAFVIIINHKNKKNEKN